jgi:hypothetical protein
MSDVKPVLHHFYVDNKEYSSDKNFLTGLEIKNIAGVPGNYQLFLEEEGDQPDRAISDGDTVSVGRKEHFFAVPPATFG